MFRTLYSHVCLWRTCQWLVQLLKDSLQTCLLGTSVWATQLAKYQQCEKKETKCNTCTSICLCPTWTCLFLSVSRLWTSPLPRMNVSLLASSREQQWWCSLTGRRQPCIPNLQSTPHYSKTRNSTVSLLQMKSQNMPLFNSIHSKVLLLQSYLVWCNWHYWFNYSSVCVLLLYYALACHR